MKRQILENMMDKIVHKYGLEAAETIQFCRLVEAENKAFSAEIGRQFKKLMEA